MVHLLKQIKLTIFLDFSREKKNNNDDGNEEKKTKKKKTEKRGRIMDLFIARKAIPGITKVVIRL